MSTLTNDLKDSLYLFAQKTQELLKSRIIKEKRETLSSRMTFDSRPCGGMTAEFDGYDSDMFKSFWTTLRQIALLESEDIYFYKICNIVRKNCDREELNNWVDYARDNWKKLLKDEPVVKFAMEEMTTNEKLLKFWVNGVVFHADNEKYALWNSLIPPMQNDAMLSIQALTPRMIQQLLIVENIIRFWLDEPNAEVPPVPKI